MFKNSVKIMAASAVAVIGCMSNPIDPEDADILAIPCVIINCPPNWHKKAKANKFKNSFNDDGIKLLDSNMILLDQNYPSFFQGHLIDKMLNKIDCHTKLLIYNTQ